MQKILLVFFMNVCLVNVISLRDGDPCQRRNDWNVHLALTVNESHLKLNKLFKEDINKKIPNVYVAESIVFDAELMLNLNYYNSKYYDEHTQEWKPNNVVVYLFAKDLYKHNYNDILKRNFIHVGNDNLTAENHFNAKLVSNNVKLYPALYDYIVTFNENDDIQQVNMCKSPINVVVCGNDEPPLELIKDFEIRYEPNCEQIKTDSTTVAVLAPKPFDISETMFIPTIFYDEHFTLPETSHMFVNSLSWPKLMTEKMIFAFKKFMKTNDWNRVAIISDDTPTSKKFEQELTALFKTDNIIYVSRSCDVLNCDFAELLRPVIAAKPKLIIVNVGEDLASAFTEQVSQMQLPRIVWILRAWSEHAATEAAYKGIGDVVSITSDFTMEVGDRQTAIINAIQGCFINFEYKYKIRRLRPSYRNDYYKYIYEQLQRNPKSNYREIACAIADILQDETAIRANVTWYQSTSSAFISSMTIKPSNEVDNYQTSNPPPYIRTDVGDCSFKTNVYMKPCNEEEFMFLFLVIVVFVLMVVGILHFFQSTEMSYSRMAS